MIKLELTELEAYMLLEAADDTMTVDSDFFEEHGEGKNHRYVVDQDTEANWKKLIGKIRSGIDGDDPSVIKDLLKVREFHHHIIGAHKRVDWGRSSVDWAIVNEGLMGLDVALEKLGVKPEGENASKPENGGRDGHVPHSP